MGYALHVPGVIRTQTCFAKMALCGIHLQKVDVKARRREVLAPVENHSHIILVTEHTAVLVDALCSLKVLSDKRPSRSIVTRAHAPRQGFATDRAAIRQSNAHALINAAFRLTVAGGVVTEVRLA